MDSNIFKKFSDNLRKIFILAERIARDSSRPMDSEDMLLALTLTRGTLASDILLNFEIVPDRVQIVAKLISNQNKKNPSTGLSEDAKKVIRDSVKIAAKFGHIIVDAEHLLLALVSDPKLNAYSVIERIGQNPIKIKEQIEVIFNEIAKASGVNINSLNIGLDQLNTENIPTSDEFVDSPLPNFGHRVATKDLAKTQIEQFTIDLTKRAKEKKLDPLIGRQDEIERVSQILSRRTKNHPMLIGEPGVGKTAIVEGLAEKIIQGNVPQTLVGGKILSLDIGSLLAGTMYRGQFESRIKKLLADIKNLGNVILFIDEIHTTIGTGSAEGSLDTANMLKPILSTGDYKIIGATTYDEYKKHIEKDPAYERRFQIVRINEPTVEETLKILKGLKHKYEDHHKIRFTKEALESAVELSNRYITDRYMPDKAIDLIDEAAAATNIISKNVAKISQLKAKFSEIISKKDEAVNNENYEAATNFREEEIKISDEINKLNKDYFSEKKNVIDQNDIAKVAARWTGINVEELTMGEKKRYLNLESRLQKFVIGQNEAIKEISISIRRNRAGISDPRRPIGSYLFLGPTGVGKTHLSKTLAKILFGTEENIIKIDMSEFMEKHNVSRLIGAPAGYVGYDDGGKLTEAVRHKPYSIILFDEIEKAHPEVFNILLQILEDGYLTDAKGRRVNFRNTIIILTSNIGTDELNKNASIGFQAKGAKNKKEVENVFEKLKENILDIVKRELRPEFINRLDNIIVFRPLDKKSIEKIVKINLDELSARLKKQGISLIILKSVIKHLAESGYSEEFGARPIRRIISEQLENPISEAILSEKLTKNQRISVHLVDKKIILKK